MTTPKINF